MRRLYYTLFLFIILLHGIKAQRVESGNLLRIKMDSSAISLNDTLGYWFDSNISTPHYYQIHTKEYYDHFRLNDKSYFLIKTNFYHDSPVITQVGGVNQLVNESSNTARTISWTGIGWDFLIPYMIDKTIVIQTSGGNWLINGVFGSSFISQDDSLYKVDSQSENRFITIPGFVNAQPLAVFENKNYGSGSYSKNKYYLTDLSDISLTDMSNYLEVEFTDIKNSAFWDNPLKIKSLSNNLYLVQKEAINEIDIYKFENYKFYPVKTLLKDYFPIDIHHPFEWHFSNGKFHAVSSYKVNYHIFKRLISFDFNSSDTSFINETILIDSLENKSYCFDRNFRNFAAIKDSTLIIYNMDNGKFTNSISLRGVDSPSRPFIDSPYVYVHQVKYRYTGVEDENKLNPGSYRLSAYPNPFNASVKIFYYLPEDKEIELSIYDMLGRKVETLVNGFEKKGSHEAVFNAKNLSSGIYFYNLSTDNYRKTNKLLLLK